MSYNTFNDFILALHAIDKGAARFLATECIKKDEVKELNISFSVRYLHKSPIEDWREGTTLNELVVWRTDNRFLAREQAGGYWSKLRIQMKEKREQLTARLNTETAGISWAALERHFAR